MRPADRHSNFLQQSGLPEVDTLIFPPITNTECLITFVTRTLYPVICGVPVRNSGTELLTICSILSTGCVVSSLQECQLLAEIWIYLLPTPTKGDWVPVYVVRKDIFVAAPSYPKPKIWEFCRLLPNVLWFLWYICGPVKLNILGTLLAPLFVTLKSTKTPNWSLYLSKYCQERQSMTHIPVG